MNNQICIIAEKPSVAREIARIVGATEMEGYLERYYVTWAFGHLSCPPYRRVRHQGFHRDNLPIIPPVFTCPGRSRREKATSPTAAWRHKLKSSLFRESDKIIVATDAGRGRTYLPLFVRASDAPLL